MPIDPPAATTFIHANGRLLEQLVHAHLFDGGDRRPAVRAVLAYQNGDGGFGHGLEPDKRCPASQPLDVEIALERLHSVGGGETMGPGVGAMSDDVSDAVLRACEFLAGVAAPSGAVPVLLPSIAGWPRAAHWSATDEYPPGLNPTASIAGYLHALGARHPWLDRATEWCFSEIEREGPPGEAHALLCVTRLLEHAPDRQRVGAVEPAVRAAVPASAMFQERPDPDAYGVTPLELAPAPTSLARAWFADGVITAHLDALERQQQSDGGWPIRWEPPSEASRCEWRAIRTLTALRVLTAYGRMPAGRRDPASAPA